MQRFRPCSGASGVQDAARDRTDAVGAPPELPPRLWVVILNYNAGAFLEACVDSVLADPTERMEVIVVDNASSDGSADHLAKSNAQADIWQMEANLGYTKAYNRALERILGRLKQEDADPDHEYVVFLNADAVVMPGALRKMLGALEQTNDVAAVQPKLLSMQDPSRFDYSGGAGGFADRWGFPFTRGRVLETIEKDRGQYDAPQDIFWACGACSMVRASALWDAGLLDERFEMHMEEIDLCWRFWLRGWRVRSEPGAVVHHYVSASLPAKHLKRLFCNHKNSLCLLVKNFGRRRLCTVLPLRICMDAVIFAVALFGGNRTHAWAISCAYAWVLRNAAYIMRMRRRVQAERRRSDQEITRRLHGVPLLAEYFVFGKKTCDAIMYGRKRA